MLGTFDQCWGALVRTKADRPTVGNAFLVPFGRRMSKLRLKPFTRVLQKKLKMEGALEAFLSAGRESGPLAVVVVV